MTLSVCIRRPTPACTHVQARDDMLMMQPGFRPGLPGSRGRIEDIQGMQSCATCSFLTLVSLSSTVVSPTWLHASGGVGMGVGAGCLILDMFLCVTFTAVSVIPAVCHSGQALCLVESLIQRS